MRYFEKVESVTGDFQYVRSQYESHNKGKFEYREMISARYIEANIPDLQGNPLVEALPPIRELSDIVESIENIIPFSTDERQLSDSDRMDRIMALNELFVFQFQHMSIASKMDRAIRSGYIGKSIPTRKILKDYGLEREDLQYIGFNENDETYIPSGIQREDLPIPKGFVLVGASGSGKTKTIKRLLLNYPRLILHKEYRDERILFKQVPWIKVEGTYNRSLKGIGASFFHELDNILGTTYAVKFKTLSIDAQIEKMKELSIRHQIGLFVFDEVQYINQNSIHEVVNYLNKLHNELPIPIIYIGTYSLYTWMQNVPYTLVRRMEGSGLEEWMRMKNDEEFKRFLNEIWHYQWVKNPPILSEEMINVFYEQTMGITERVIRLFQLCQMTAIELEKETFNVKDVLEASSLMPFTSEIIKAMKQNNYAELEKLDGMIKVDVTTIVKNKKATIQVRENEKQMIESIYTDEVLETKKLKSELLASALQFGFEKTMVEDAVAEVVKGKGKRKSISTLKQELIKILFTMKTEKNTDEALVPSATALETTLNQRMKVGLNNI